MTKTFNCIDLFTGCGGIALSTERAGFKHAAFCEIDPVAQSVLRRNFPGVRIINDVKAVNKKTITGSIDAIFGGSPCQDFSMAGLRAGLGGERSGLWFEYLRVVREFAPQWIVFENVAGLLSSWSAQDEAPCPNEVRHFDSREEAERWASDVQSTWTVEESCDLATIITGLEELGYICSWRLFDAQYFGVAQRRQRIMLVGSLRNAGSLEILFERGGRVWDPAPRRRKRQDSSGRALGGDRGDASGFIPEVAGTVTAGYADNGGITGGNNHRTTNLVAVGGANSNAREVSTGVRAKSGQGHMDFESETFIIHHAPEISHPLTSQGHDASDDGTGRGTPYICIKGASIGRKPEAGPQRGDILEDETVFTLTTNEVHSVMAWTERPRPGGRNVELQEELAYTVTTGSGGNDTKSTIASGQFGIRRLMPIECERLQGMPDDWTRFADDGSELSDSARYRLIGNSVALPMTQWIADRIVRYETGQLDK